jgi:hypothetical protein
MILKASAVLVVPVRVVAEIDLELMGRRILVDQAAVRSTSSA